MRRFILENRALPDTPDMTSPRYPGIPNAIPDEASTAWTSPHRLLERTLEGRASDDLEAADVQRRSTPHLVK